MFKYFRNVKTEDDVKAMFKELAKKHHPDCGGNAEIFKEMYAEYKIAFEKYKGVHETQAGETYKKETQETPEMFADLIEKLLKMDGVKIEIIGSWIWLTGNTMTYKEEIKELKFFWSKTKKSLVLQWKRKKEQKKRSL